MDYLELGVHDDLVSFFDDFPPHSPKSEVAPRVRQPWDGPPAGWLGGWVPWRIVLLRSSDALAVLRDFEAFPTGLGFSLVTSIREVPDEYERRPGRHASFFAVGQGLRLGVAFADGRKTVAGRHMVDQPTGDPNQPVLRPGGGGGSGSTYRMSFWLWPLPPPGPLTWAGQWPDSKTQENTVQVDGTVLQTAAGEAEQLWHVDANEGNQPPPIVQTTFLSRGTDENQSETDRS